MEIANLNQFLPITDAIRLSGKSEPELYDRIKDGNIRAVRLSSGAVAVSQDDVISDLPKTERPEYKLHAHLAGVGISVREAERRYGIASQTLSRWSAKGYIAVVAQDGNKKLLDEADVAYCADIYKSHQGQGKWVFNPDGTPYVSR